MTVARAGNHKRIAPDEGLLSSRHSIITYGADADLTASPRDSHSKRLLLITYHFPPDGAVGGLRWAGLAKYLVRLGWEVHVIAAVDARSVNQDAGVHYYCSRRRRTLNDYYNAAARRLRRSAVIASPRTRAVAPTSLREPGRLAKLLASVRTVGGLALTFPDDGRGWVLRAGMAARSLRKRHTFDAVVTSGPPHSAHFAGILATVGSCVPHIVDMRDPWRGSSRNCLGYPVKSRILHTLLGLAEGLAFWRARDVIVNTPEFAERLRETRPQLRISHIPNGADLEALPQREGDFFDGISIAYAGTIYLGRSFSTVFAALAALVRERPDCVGRVKLRIAGSLHHSLAAQFWTEVDANGLRDVVELYGTIPRAQALDLLRRSHLALVLAQAQPTQIPAKLYECVGLGIPTLVLSEDDSAASREARRIGAMAIPPGRAAELRELLGDLIDRRLPLIVSPSAPISYELLALEADRVLRQRSERAARM